MTFFNDLVSDPIVFRLGWALVHSVWQVVAISTILFVGLWLLRNRSPGARYFTSCVALITMVAAVLVTFSLVKPPRSSPELVTSSTATTNTANKGALDPSTESAAHLIVRDTAVAPDRHSDDAVSNSAQARIANVSLLFGPALPWIVCCWLCGVLTMCIWYLGGWYRLQRLCHFDVQPVSAKIQRMLRDVMRRLSITRAITLLESSRIDVPATIGSLRPVILLPGCVLTGLSPQQLEAILAHELAHIRRHDYLLNLVQVVIETLLFYHPAVWWVSRRIRVERENCCDDIALRACGNRMMYARALTRLEEIRGTDMPASLAMAASGSDAGSLLSRIRRVLGVSRANRSLSRPWLGGCVATLLVAVTLATTFVVTAANPPDDAESAARRSVEEFIKEICGPTPAIPNLSGEETEVELRMVFERLTYDDIPKLLAAFRDKHNDLTARMCLASHLARLANKEARTFILECLDGKHVEKSIDGDEPTLKVALSSPGVVKLNAAYALKFAATGEDPTTPWGEEQMIRVVRDEVVPARSRAFLDICQRLGELRVEGAVDVLIRVIEKHPQADEPALALGELYDRRYRSAPAFEEPDYRRAEEILLKTVENRNKLMRAHAYALHKMDSPSLLAILLRHLDDDMAISLLVERKERGAIEPLREYVESGKDRSGDARIALARIESMNFRELAARLIALLEDETLSENRWRIIEPLGETRDWRAVDSLVKLGETCTDDLEWSHVIDALEEIGGDAAVRGMVRLLSRDFSTLKIDGKPPFRPAHEELVEALQKHTRQQFGNEPAKWQAWLRGRSEKDARRIQPPAKSGDVDALRRALKDRRETIESLSKKYEILTSMTGEYFGNGEDIGGSATGRMSFFFAASGDIYRIHDGRRLTRIEKPAEWLVRAAQDFDRRANQSKKRDEKVRAAGAEIDEERVDEKTVNETVIKTQLEKLGARVSTNGGKITEVRWDENRVKDREVIKDVELKLLRGLSSLKTLKLDRSPVTDADLSHISELRGLTGLSLYRTDITDVGFGHLHDLKNLHFLGLQGTSVGDASMKLVKEFENLSHLYLSGANITDEGVAEIANLNKLKTLYLNNTRITDDAMVHVKGLTKLETLYLHNTMISDEGITHLLMLQNLKVIHIANTQVTDKGVKYLRDSIPQLKITTAFGRP